MPKIYRVMRRAGDKPELGESASALGVRVPHDISPDENNQVHPGSGGMSVSPSLAALRSLPGRMVPRRLRTVIPGALGNDALFVWSMGRGGWPQAESLRVEDLQLRVDPKNNQHGFVEPDTMMSLEQYRAALAQTQDQWRVDEE